MRTKISGGVVAASVTCVAMLTLSGSGWAQSSNAAAAEALFEKGRKLMVTGDYEQACPKFVESQRLDPASGTLLNLGKCYEKAGRTAGAWAAYKQAASMARREGNSARADFANKHIASLAPVLSYVTVAVDADSQKAGVKVLVDETPMNAASWGVAIPMDPGEHNIRVTAPGRKTWSKQITLGKRADKQTVHVPALAHEKAAPDGTSQASSGSTAGSTSSGQSSVDGSTDTGASGAGGNTWAYVAGGVGLVGLAVGGYFGVAGMSKWKERNDHCYDIGCDETGLAAGKVARRARAERVEEAPDKAERVEEALGKEEQRAKAERVEEALGKEEQRAKAERVEEALGKEEQRAKAERAEEAPGKEARRVKAERVEEAQDKEARRVKAERVEEAPGKEARRAKAERVEEAPGKEARRAKAERVEEAQDKVEQREPEGARWVPKDRRAGG